VVPPSVPARQPTVTKPATTSAPAPAAKNTVAPNAVIARNCWTIPPASSTTPATSPVRNAHVPAPGSYPRGPEIDRILANKDGVTRNYAITQGYHDLSQAFATVVGDENANWTTYAVWASRQAGVSIRKEDAPELLVDLLERSPEISAALDRVKRALGPLGVFMPPVGKFLEVGDGALDVVSGEIAEGNARVFAEISREFTRFIDTFAGAEKFDQARLDAYLAGFRPDQQVFRDGMEAYALAMFEKDPNRKAELMLEGNALVGLHEQTFLQTYIERAMNAPVDHLIANGLKSVFGEKLGAKLLDEESRFHDVISPLVRTVSSVVRRGVTEQMMKLAMPGRTLSLGEDVVGPNGATSFSGDLATIESERLRKVLARVDQTPDTMKGSGAKDWVRLDDRMNFIVDLFRAYQQDPAVFGQPFESPVVVYS
jgi:hypothetical protein